MSSKSVNNSVVNSLKNRGAVPLSSSNPFLAGNVLLSKECLRSSELAGFINHRGSPKSIEVVKNWTGPTLIRMYYLDKNEYFVAEQSGDTWLIQGPGKIPEKGIKMLQGLVEPGEAPALIETKSEITTNTKLPSPIDLPPEIAEPAISQEIEDSETKDPLMNTILKLKNEAKDPAELSPKGDLVHYVTYSGETLIMISRWYTLDARNLGRISRINNLKNPSQLEIGDTIVIPSYLVKNKNRLNEATVKTLALEFSNK
ncbi:MAG: hypothetical protein SGJ02_10000 [bacterium]|nr:hypothetical protein [bacterium]